MQPEPLEWVEELGGELAYEPSMARLQLPLVVSLREMLAMIECPLLSARGRLALRALYASGARPGEILGLQLDPAGGVKLGGRRVPLDDRTLEGLHQLEGPLASSEAELLEWATLAARQVGVWDRLEGAGRPLSLRLFRHAFGAHCMEGGMDLITLYYLLGHRFLETTQMYYEVAVGRSRKVYERYHPLVSWKPQEGERQGECVPRGRGGLTQAKIAISEALGLIASCSKDRDRLVLRVLYATALREAELLALRWADLEEQERRLFVRSGKGPRDRYTLIDAETVRQLVDFRGERLRQDRVFSIQSHMTVYNIVKRQAIKTGIWDRYKSARRSLSPHTLRHAYAGHCYERGMELYDVGRLMGHSFLQNTLTYAHCPLETQARSYALSHPLQVPLVLGWD